MFQLSGAQGNIDPAAGPKTVEYAEQCGKELAEAVRDIPLETVPEKNLLKLVNRTVDLPYEVDKVTPEAVVRHADSLAATAITAFPRFARDVQGWKEEILARFETGEVPSKLRFHLHGVNLNGIVFFFSDGEPFCEYQMEARAAFPEGRIPISPPSMPTRYARATNMKSSRCTCTSRLRIPCQKRCLPFTARAYWRPSVKP